MRRSWRLHQGGPTVWPELAERLGGGPADASLHGWMLWRITAAAAAAAGHLDDAVRMVEERLHPVRAGWMRALATLDRIELHLAEGELEQADRALGSLAPADLRPTFTGRAEGLAAALGARLGRQALVLPRPTLPTERAWVELHAARIAHLRGAQVAPTLQTSREADRLLIELGFSRLDGGPDAAR